MTDDKVQMEGQDTEMSPSGGDTLVDQMQEDIDTGREGPRNSGRGLEALAVLVDVALAPPCGDGACLDVVSMDLCLQSLQMQHQFMMNKADALQNLVVNGVGEHFAPAVQSFLYTCQPYFNYLESTARTSLNHYIPPTFDFCSELLELSQQMSDKLEQLVLMYASWNLLCVDATQHNSVSPFPVGQFHFRGTEVTVLRFCKPAPYVDPDNTGLYKRMSWKVEKLRDEQHREAETDRSTDYYFLCYEDVPIPAKDNQSSAQSEVIRLWTIVQWVQMKPDPDTGDIYEWILCKVPKCKYRRLMFVGLEEPSSGTATNCLLQLLSQQ